MELIDWIIPIRVVDLLEITVVSYLLYKLYMFMRGTIAVQIFLGLMALYAVQVIVAAIDMTMLPALFASIGEVAVLAIIILFQPEIRRVLLLLGQNPLVRRFVTSSAHEDMLAEVTAAAAEMSKNRIGALIAFERSSGLRNYIETGTLLQASVTRDLLVTIFYGQNPLHDGAVIISSRRLEAARCILPVSTSMKLSQHLGLRHRAAVGLTEQTDAFVVVVSEETGTISVAMDGELISNLTVNELRNHLRDAFTMQSQDTTKALTTAESE
ncbi:MAG: diadenylate cyclase CdaA [Rhodothermales bacterium]